jgi:hypothetical protein
MDFGKAKFKLNAWFDVTTTTSKNLSFSTNIQYGGMQPNVPQK